MANNYKGNKQPNSFFSIQNIIIIIMILSYILIFFAYRHDINQCNTIIEKRELALENCDCPTFSQTGNDQSTINNTLPYNNTFLDDDTKK